MIPRRSKIGVLIGIWIGGVGVFPLSAELPTLGEKKWLGHFIGFENKKFSYGFTVQGKSFFKVVGAKDQPLSAKLAVQVDFVVQEILPSGKTYERLILPQSLQSSQPAGNHPKNVIIRGKVKGDASFEISVDEDRGVISLGGHLIDKGTLVNNPVRFLIRVKFPNAYPYTKRDGDKERKEAFKEKIKNDRLWLTWTDGKRVKPATDKVLDVCSKDINGPGISGLQIEFGPYDGKKIECVASANSVIALSSRQAGPLHDGFVVNWVMDSTKDPAGQARLNISVR